MRIPWSVGICLSALACLPILEGCRRGPGPAIAVTGKVTYKGGVVPGGFIVFSPDRERGHSGAIASSRIDADGSYELKTDDRPGAEPGWYRITLVALDPGSGLASGRYSIPASLLPEKYRDPELSQLTCEVKPNRPNRIDFNLD